MKFLLLVVSLGAAVFARPDVSHLDGYQYKPPTTSYGVPVDNRYDSGHHHHQVSNVPTGSYLPGNLQVPHAQGHVNFLGGSSGNNANRYDGFNPQLIQDQKHVYYYAAPDEEESPRLRIHITPNNQKNTNVIFVKAPNYAPAIPEVISPPSQAEERTKVFVLVQKPEQPAPISIPAPTHVKSKPEVYVVKYKDQHEAEQAISGGRGGHPIGVNVHHLNDEDSFVKTLHTDSRLNIPQNDKYSGFDGNVDFVGLRSGINQGDLRSGSSLLGSTSSGSDGSSSLGVHGESNHPTGGFGSSFEVRGGSPSSGFGGSSSSVLNADSHLGGSVGVHGGNDGLSFTSGSHGGDSGSTTFGVSGGSRDGGVFPSGSHGSGGSTFEVSGVSRDGGVFPSGSHGSGGSTFEVSGVSRDGGVFPSGSHGSGGATFEVSGVKKDGDSFGSFGSLGNAGSLGNTFEVTGGKQGGSFGSLGNGGSSGTTFEVSGVTKDGDSFHSSGSLGSGGSGFEVSSGSKDGNSFTSSSLGSLAGGFHESGGVDSLKGRLGGDGADTFSSSSLSGSVSAGDSRKDESLLSRYGPPGASGPY